MKRALILAGLVMFSLPASWADTIYQQPPVWAGNGTSLGNALTSHSDGTVTGNRTIDNFVIGTNVTIDGASWLGVYLDVSDPANVTDGAPTRRPGPSGSMATTLASPQRISSGARLLPTRK